VDDDRDHGAEYEAEREGTPSPPQRRPSRHRPRRSQTSRAPERARPL
jgi:hypothetical protein